MLGGLFGMHDRKQTQEAPAHPGKDFTVTHPGASAIPRDTASLSENTFLSTFRERVLAGYSQDFLDLAGKDHLG